MSELLSLGEPGQPGETERRTDQTGSSTAAGQLPCLDDAGSALKGSNSTLIEGRSDERAGTQDPGDEEAGMDTVASSTGPAIAGDRSGAGALVIVVGGAAQRRAAGAATAPLAGPVMVVVLGGWPVRVLAVGGPLTTRLVDGPGLAVDDRRPPLPEGYLVRRAGPGSAGRGRDAAEDAEPSAAGLPSEVGGNVFRREGEYWTVVFDGVVVRLRDAKGLGHLARLLAHPGREFHAVDLEGANRQAGPAAVGPGGRVGAGELQVRPDLGDAGALLDATAKAAYRARLAELRAELEQAEAGNDPARATRARAEREFLVAELARAVGLGGRDRRAASHAERARLNATRAIRAAMANLGRANPSLGRHLAATVRTGRYCAYTPDPRAPIAWQR